MDKPVILITGALSGIGRATAVAFAQKGAKLAVAGRHDAAGVALAEELRSFGSEAEFINADVRKEDNVRPSAAAAYCGSANQFERGTLLTHPPAGQPHESPSPGPGQLLDG